MGRGNKRTTNTVVQRRRKRKYIVEKKVEEAEMNVPLAEVLIFM